MTKPLIHRSTGKQIGTAEEIGIQTVPHFTEPVPNEVATLIDMGDHVEYVTEIDDVLKATLRKRLR